MLAFGPYHSKKNKERPLSFSGTALYHKKKKAKARYTSIHVKKLIKLCIGHLDKILTRNSCFSFVKFGCKFSYHLDYLRFQWKKSVVYSCKDVTAVTEQACYCSSQGHSYAVFIVTFHIVNTSCHNTTVKISALHNLKCLVSLS